MSEREAFATPRPTDPRLKLPVFNIPPHFSGPLRSPLRPRAAVSTFFEFRIQGTGHIEDFRKLVAPRCLSAELVIEPLPP